MAGLIDLSGYTCHCEMPKASTAIDTPFDSSVPFRKLEVKNNNGFILGNQCIPEEVLTLILSFVDPKELLQCCFVCPQWNNLIKSCSLWTTIYKRNYNKKPKPLPWYLYYKLLTTNYFDTNLLQNGNGQNNFDNWNIFQSGGNGWKIEAIPDGADPLPQNVPEFSNKISCFATSYNKCCKKQEIKFGKSKLFQHILNCYKPHIYLSEWMAGRFDCGCVYYLTCGFTDLNNVEKKVPKPSTKRTVAQWQGRQWTKIELNIAEYPHNIGGITFEHSGVDTQFWAGHYGSKMAGGVVKLLFDSINPLDVDESGNIIPKEFNGLKVTTNGEYSQKFPVTISVFPRDATGRAVFN